MSRTDTSQSGLGHSDASDSVPAQAASGKRELPEAAKRALAEAEARRAAQAAQAAKDGEVRKELGGVDGPDPVRYGDWENGGIASDF